MMMMTHREDIETNTRFYTYSTIYLRKKWTILYRNWGIRKPLNTQTNEKTKMYGKKWIKFRFTTLIENTKVDFIYWLQKNLHNVKPMICNNLSNCIKNIANFVLCLSSTFLIFFLNTTVHNYFYRST